MHEAKMQMNEKPVRRRRRSEAGLTLIEMLVVVTIIMLFIGVVGPRMFTLVEDNRAKAARAQIESFKSLLHIYSMQNGKLPTTEQGLAALRSVMDRDLPMDPWGNPYVYKYPGEHGAEPDLISYGADGKPGGEGPNADIVSWK